jgi:hypothetical protein
MAAVERLAGGCLVWRGAVACCIDAGGGPGVMSVVGRATSAPSAVAAPKKVECRAKSRA